MTSETARKPSQRDNRTIILPIKQEKYDPIVLAPQQFRAWKVWNVYYSTTRRMMSQRIRRLRDWAMKNGSGVVLEKVLALCDKREEWSVWYDNENAYTTSNELDRLMRSQNRYFDRGQHFHGTFCPFQHYAASCIALFRSAIIFDGIK